MTEYNNPFTIGRTKYVKGNASRPVSTDNRTIVLFVSTTGDFEKIEGNDTVAKVYPKAKEFYRAWWRSQNKFKPGELQVNTVMSDTEIAHLIAYVEVDGQSGFEEKALRSSIDKLGKHAALNKTNVHVNKCKDEEAWALIAKLLEELVAKRAVNVFVYEE